MDSPFLLRLTYALKEALSKHETTTADFVSVCDQLLPVFDDLGLAFIFAKKEFLSKNESLAKVANTFLTLKDLVDSDKKQGTVNAKGSCARNLHRLGSALMFVTILVTELTKASSVTLKEAAQTAYETALAPIHTMIVRNVVLAGLLTLPSRETFLQSIEETEESAKEHVTILQKLVDPLVNKVHALYDEPMPVSNTWFISN